MRFSAVLLCLWLVGCTHTYDVHEEPFDGYPAAKKLDLTVRLIIPQELEQAKWQRKSMGDTYRLLLGPALTRNVRILADTLFTRVIEDEVGPDDPGPDAILTPRLVSIERTLGATAYGDSVLSVVLEWTLTDPNGKIVWVDTVSGSGTANSGNLFSVNKHTRNQSRLMFEELFRGSFEAMSVSPEIRRYASSRSAPPAAGEE